MNPKTRFPRHLRVRFGWVVLAAALVAGCSTSNNNGTGGGR